MTAIQCLLSLDQAYPSDFEGEDSIGCWFDYARGFDELEVLQKGENEEIFEKARELLEQFYPGDVNIFEQEMTDQPADQQSNEQANSGKGAFLI